MYKVALSEKTFQATQNIPDSCFPDNLTAWRSLGLWFKNQFSWSNDECSKYHEALLVDPMLEVSPLTVSNILVDPILEVSPRPYIGGISSTLYGRYLLDPIWEVSPRPYMGGISSEIM